ncbi:winged helix-turn-helix transcriptional regulator [Mixta calida]|nr:winged helix-turn-helix transcriptional regulator [Mixta calida]
MSLSKTERAAGSVPALEEAMAALAAAIADPSRIAILCALMDGRAWTATELSAAAGVTPSTTSGHLAKLLDNGLVRCLSQGRHRYYSLAGQQIAGLLENLMGVSMSAQAAPTPRTPGHLRHARTCYDHLAGELAVRIYDAMLAQAWLTPDGLALTTAGRAQLLQMGAQLDPRPRRKACCPCLDWSERRFHLGGDTGAALLRLCLQKGWLIGTPGYREISVTQSGKSALRRLFAVDAEQAVCR